MTIDSLCQECAVYTRYLVDCEPSPYILQKYAEAFAAGRPLANLNNSGFDTLIEKISIKNTLFTRAIDGYCKLFYRTSRVRKKLMLLLAILETQTTTAQIIDTPDNKNPPLLLLTFLAQITRSFLLLLISTSLLSPIRLVTSCIKRLSGS